MTRSRTVDMCEGPLLPNILQYMLPLIATGLLQLLYNAADVVVVARWAGGTALAAVGSTGSLVTLITNFAIGISAGASVVISRAYGAKNDRDVHESVHTAMALGVICGVVTMAVGLLVARQALVWMSSPADVIDQATLYLRIYFLGMPAAMIYNFGAAVLRSVGDTRRPLYILTLSGIVNVVLNLILVIGFHMDVAGVAIATTVSQVISAVLVVYSLTGTTGTYHYDISKTRLHKDKCLLMLRHGVPAGIQSTIFSISNIIIQSSVNSFGSAVVAGNSAAANLEGFVYVAMNSLYQTNLTFTSQNVGANKPKRLKKINLTCVGIVTVIGLLMGVGVYLLRESLLLLYTASSSTSTTISASEIIRYGTVRLSYICLPYFLCGVMDTLVGGLRGLGSSWTPMLVSIGGVCGIRIVWIFTVFRYIDHSLVSLFLSYPVSWAATALVHAIFYSVVVRRKIVQLELTCQKTEG